MIFVSRCLPKDDIQVLIAEGTPFLFKSSLETERKMRSFLQVCIWLILVDQSKLYLLELTLHGCDFGCGSSIYIFNAYFFNICRGTNQMKQQVWTWWSTYWVMQAILLYILKETLGRLLNHLPVICWERWLSLTVAGQLWACPLWRNLMRLDQQWREVNGYAQSKLHFLSCLIKQSRSNHLTTFPHLY